MLGTKGIAPRARPKQYDDRKPWRGKWETAGGGCMINQSVHTLDLLTSRRLGKSLRASVSQLLTTALKWKTLVPRSSTYADGGKGLFIAPPTPTTKMKACRLAYSWKRRISPSSKRAVPRRPGRFPRGAVEDARLPDTKFYYGASHAKLIGKFYKALEDGTDDYIHVRRRNEHTAHRRCAGQAARAAVWRCKRAGPQKRKKKEQNL